MDFKQATISKNTPNGASDDRKDARKDARRNDRKDDDFEVKEHQGREHINYSRLYVMPEDTIDFYSKYKPCDIKEWENYYSSDINALYSSCLRKFSKMMPHIRFNHMKLYKDFIQFAYDTSPQCIPMY